MRRATLTVFYPKDSQQFMIGCDCMGSKVVSITDTDEVATVILADETCMQFRDVPRRFITHGEEV